MNKAVTDKLLRQEVESLQCLSYGDLLQRVDHPETKEVLGDDGKAYQISVDVFRDDNSDGVFRVVVSIDDKSWRAFVPQTISFLANPDLPAK